MNRLQIATVAMTGAALIISATLLLSSVAPMTTHAVSNRIGAMAIAYNDAQLAREFDKLYPQYKSQLPVRLDDRTTLTKVCADGDMRMTMMRGAIYEYQYLDRQSRLVGSFDIRNADCAS